MKTKLLKLRRVLNVTLLILLMNVAGIINAFAGDYEPDDFIAFADANVKALCVANWDTNGDGELSYVEAAAVTDLGEVFRNNSTIMSFDELQYFIGLIEIGKHAFSNCTALTSIVIPSNVTAIDNFAFDYCIQLASTTIPNGVTSIGLYAFRSCENMVTLEIPESVTAIYNAAFRYCYRLEQIVVSEGNTVYDSRENCNAIVGTNSNKLLFGCKNTTIPNSVKALKDYACYGMDITEIHIHDSLLTIGTNVFGGCSLLEQITVAAGNPVYDSRNQCNAIVETATNKLVVGCKNTVIPDDVTAIGKDAFCGCLGLTSYVIPNNVATIGDYAFDLCRNLTSIVLPNNISSIGYCSFDACYQLASITIMAYDPPTLGNYAFSGVDNSIPVAIPTGALDSYTSAPGWSDFTNYVEDADMPIAFADENVKALCVANWDTNDDGELSYAEAAAVTDLGDVFTSNYYINTFDELQYFTGLTAIGENAFAWCQGLTSVVLPSTVMEIGFQAFYDCSILSITIPAAVTNIGYSALGCEYLETIVVEEGNTIYDSRDNCNAVIITSSNELLRGCKNTVIPNTVESIGLNAFSSCTIESIAIPASITYIDNTSFYACENLSEITVSTDNTVYDSRNNCNAIIETSTNILVAGSKTTIIPSTVTAIDNNAFSYRFSSGSYNITIPESVVSIGEYNQEIKGETNVEIISVIA